MTGTAAPTQSQQIAAPLPCVVAYHEFAHNKSRDVYQLTPAVFEEHVRLLQAGCTRLRRELTITFDDGHRSQVELAAPALQRAGLRGTFFVPAGWVGCRRETAAWSDLRRLVGAGHRIGSHGHTHALLTRCSPDALRSELVRSRETLEDGLGSEVRTISLPGGRGNALVLAACQAAGYREVYTSDPRPAQKTTGTTGDAFAVLGRLVVRRTTRAGTLRGYASRDSATMALLDVEHRAKRALKHLLGDVAYQSVWRRLLRAPAKAISFGER